jgi:hypothetical protein
MTDSSIQIDIATMQQFVVACETYIQFCKEYGAITEDDKKLLAFCEYVINNKPYHEIKTQIDQLVARMHKVMMSGIIIERNKKAYAGAFFGRPAKPEPETVIYLNGGERTYEMNMTDLCASIMCKKHYKRAKDGKQEPQDVLLFIIRMISKVIQKSVISSGLPQSVKDSICSNTHDPDISKPYGASRGAHLQKVLGAFMNHEKGKEMIDKFAGEGVAERGAQVVRTIDLASLANGANSTRIMEAYHAADVDGIFEGFKEAVASVAVNVQEGIVVADPNAENW